VETDQFEQFEPSDADGAGGEADADINPVQRSKAKQLTEDWHLQN
jgi:hypothetical protein